MDIRFYVHVAYFSLPRWQIFPMYKTSRTTTLICFSAASKCKHTDMGSKVNCTYFLFHELVSSVPFVSSFASLLSVSSIVANPKVTTFPGLH